MTAPKPNLRRIAGSNFPPFGTNDVDARFLQGSWSRTSGNGHNSFWEEHDQAPGMPGVGVAAVIVIVFVFAVIGICFYQQWTKTNNPARTADAGHQSEEFLRAVREAKEDVESSLKGIMWTGRDNLGAEPRSGEYRTKYMEGSGARERTVTLNFRREEGGGYFLFGTADGRGGKSKIEEGISSHTGYAWWREVYQSGRKAGCQVLSVGKFDFETGNFSGERKTMLGNGGQYLSFEAVECT